MRRSSISDRFQGCSIGYGLFLLGASCLLLLYSSWMVFLPFALWVGWLQVGST